MTTYYLLPCSCGKKTQVDAGQAGLSVRCECGADLAVPTMRGLSQLERAEAPVEVRLAESEESPWGARQGVIFLGAVVFLGALLPCLYMIYHYPQRPQFVTADFKELNATEIQKADLPKTWQIWKELRQGFEGQGEHPDMYAYKAVEKQARQTLIVVGVFAVLGAALMIGGLFIKPPAARPTS